MVKNISNAIRTIIICINCLCWTNNVFSKLLNDVNDQHKNYIISLVNETNTNNLQIEKHDEQSGKPSHNLNISRKLNIANNVSNSTQLQLNATANVQSNEILAVRRKREFNERNVCHSVCDCETSKNFLTANCVFQQQFAVLKPSNYFPDSTTSVLILLSQNAGLRIDENMFATNRINRISIEGTFPRGQEQLEISSNAFFGNNGPFPEIEIKNIHTVLIQPNAFYREFKLNIMDCNKVVIFAQAFVGTQFNGYFDNIPNLIILERAFVRSEAKVYINKCRIDQLQRLDTPLKEIKFTNTHINEISTGAFDVLSINSIIFENCVIGTFQKNALTVRLLSNNLAIIGSRIETMETGTIAGSGITDVIFTNNSIDKIKEKAITLTTVNVLITDNTINFVERFWIRIEDWSNVTIAHNRFGEYNQLFVEQTSKNDVQCLFANNTITLPKLGSLNFKSPYCRIRDISFQQPCTCNASLFKQLSLIDYRAHFYCTIDSTLAHCYNGTLIKILEYEREICGDSSKIVCKPNVNIKRDGTFINLNDIIKNSKKFFYIFCVAGLIIALLLAISVFYSIRCYMHKDVTTTPAQDMIIMASLHPLTPKKPATESFSNSDLLIIHESLDRLKTKYPSEIYDQIHNNTKKLIGGGLCEAERVGIIGEIVKNLVDCQDMGTDLVAFTNILYNHLGPTQDERIYFEPDETVINSSANGLYAISPNQRAGDNVNDPIYAEPQTVQLPLLKNEYMQPADKTDSDHVPFYSEPVFDSSAKDRLNHPERKNSLEVTYSQVNKATNIAVPSTSKQLSDHQIPKNSTSQKRNLPDRRYNSSSESNSCSEYSGGSGDTLQIDDIYNYKHK